MLGGGLINQGYLPFTRGKPEIPVGKSNGSCHSVWEASDNRPYHGFRRHLDG